ncbi:MAG: hypothetical protein CL581_12770 [Alteromonadaceae bacterium]|nr:hypothetical protein [Alteromonadaceae bacterium]
MAADVNKSVSINYSASTEQLERALKKIPNITDKEATKAAGELDKNFKKMESSADKTSKNVSKKMKKIGKSMAAVGASVAAVTGGVVLLSQRFADLTNELVDASTKTGIAVDTLAGLRLAAEGSGLAFANLEGGLIKFQGSMDAAASGSKNLEETFGQLGVSVKDSNGELRDADSVFNETVKALGGMENQTQRNAMAMELFGRQSGPALIQSGALDNLESMTALASEFGVAINEDGINSMAQFQRVMAEFGTVSMGTLQNVIGSIAGPNSVNMAVQGASKAVVFMGSVFSTVLGGVSQGFENVIGLINVATTAMSGDVDTARAVLGDLQRETHTAVDNLSNVFVIANDELDRFNELSSSSLGPQTMSETAEGADRAQKNINKMGEATKALIKLNKQLNDDFNESLDIYDDLTLKVSEGLTPEFEKQRRAVHQLGNEIENQTKELDYQMGVLLDHAASRELSVEEQERLNQLVDEINGLEDLAEDHRKTEIKDMTALRNQAHQRRLEQIQDETDLELQNQQMIIEKYQEKISMITSMGQNIFEAFGAISQAFSDINQSQLEQIKNQVDEETKAIDELYKRGEISANEAAVTKSSIEKGFQDQQKEMKLREFKRNKALTMADIAFKLAAGIAQALTLPPIARGIRIASLTAIAGAQTASVASQQPPKFDVGGMVGQSDGAPDVVNANLLRGEAVLDRATVDRLGGQQGVQALQNGGVGSQVVIIQPFKHFDRYNRAMSQRMSQRAGSGGY